MKQMAHKAADLDWFRAHDETRPVLMASSTGGVIWTSHWDSKPGIFSHVKLVQKQLLQFAVALYILIEYILALPRVKNRHALFGRRRTVECRELKNCELKNWRTLNCELKNWRTVWVSGVEDQLEARFYGWNTIIESHERSWGSFYSSMKDFLVRDR